MGREVLDSFGPTYYDGEKTHRKLDWATEELLNMQVIRGHNAVLDASMQYNHNYIYYTQ